MAKKKSTPSETAKMVTLKLVRSPIGYEKSQGETVRALGLRKLNHTVTVKDSDTVRGMIYKIRHLVQVVENEEA